MSKFLGDAVRLLMCERKEILEALRESTNMLDACRFSMTSLAEDVLVDRLIANRIILERLK